MVEAGRGGGEDRRRDFDTAVDGYSQRLTDRVQAPSFSPNLSLLTKVPRLPYLVHKLRMLGVLEPPLPRELVK